MAKKTCDMEVNEIFDVNGKMFMVTEKYVDENGFLVVKSIEVIA